MKQLLKSVIPNPLWRMMSALRRFIAQKIQTIQQSCKVWQWKRQFNAVNKNKKSTPADVSHLKNRLPNSGGIEISTETLNIREIVQTGQTRAEKRRTNISGFEGLALDDALGWLDEYRHYSFVPLARVVSNIAHEHLERSDFTVLELGCGWGGFRALLQAFATAGYLGVDANPLPFSHSPFVRELSNNYRLLNLQEEIDFEKKFDIVCSFEVLEHIREDSLDNILRTIANHLGPKSLFIGTAALTDYTDVHVTVHPRDWWLERFQRSGLTPVPLMLENRWLELLACHHPFNWNPKTTSIFILQKAGAPDRL